MSKLLKVGIVGCGGIANQKHLPALRNVKEVEMIAFCDTIVERAEKAAKEYGVEGAKVYSDYKEMLADGALDVVHVCTPNISHSVITIDSLEAGCHVMCEKPMAKTSEEAQAMIDAAKRTGKKLTIGYQNRFRQDSIVMKKACENGDLGDIYFAKAHAIRRRAVPTWGVFLDEEKQGGGPLIDIGTHALDITLWFMNNYKVKSVMGSKYHKLHNQTETGNMFGDWNPEEFKVEDSAFGFITMEDGATVILESAWALNTLEVGEAKSTLCGTKAGADMKDGLTFNFAEYGKLTTKKPDLSETGIAYFSGSSETPADLEAKSWVDAILNDKEPVVKPEQALVVTQILEAIYKSANTGEAVYFNK